ncbi:Peptidase S24/S26A/S26B/S26C, beta-ribbon domain protein [Nannochloropsis gaditana]|uniref:Mitochondrial inner membrane protease subunit 2 n=1 Tax=Nannochloropsis gaditana TaxID=72520 RepID=W7T4V6_9STRA|nr:Peptidase S24/S26A/S26B/S26C, beta-ribbon domain protein [Nannochloropsis gaditana]
MVTTGRFSAFASSGNVRRLLSTLSFLPVGVAVNELIGSFMFVDGRSMHPTLNPAYSGSYTSSRDLVFVAKWPIKVWRRYRKGDVVVLRSPVDPDVEVIRRLTGREREWRTRRVGMRQEPIPEGFCWVTGDNPLYSEDSETYGPVPLALIEGWVAYVVWPLNRVGPVPKRVIQAPHAQRMPPQDL